jgi:hypothetical protein
MGKKQGYKPFGIASNVLSGVPRMEECCCGNIEAGRNAPLEQQAMEKSKSAKSGVYDLVQSLEKVLAFRCFF